MRIAEINRRLAEIHTEIRSLGENITDAQLETFEREITDLQEERSRLEASAQTRSRLLESIAAGEPIANDAPPTVLRSFTPASSGEGNDSSEDLFGSMAYRKAFMAYVTRGVAMPVEYRADAIGKTSDVGAVIPSTVLNKVIETLETTGIILAKVTRTAYKGGVSIPVSTVKPTATWVVEGASSDTQKHTITTSGMITFAYHKLRCAVAVSLEVDTMSVSAFEALLVKNIAEAMVKALEQAIVSGTGSGQPTGVLASTVATDKIISVVTPAYADLVSAEAALPEAYEAGSEWYMSKKTFMQYYGLTDDNGQPIARVNYGLGGKPERSLLGRPVNCVDYVTTYTSTVAAGTIFGFIYKMEDYVLNTNFEMSLKKYEDNDTDDQVTKSIMLVDGKPVDINSLVELKKIASA